MVGLHTGPVVEGKRQEGPTESFQWLALQNTYVRFADQPERSSPEAIEGHLEVLVVGHHIALQLEIVHHTVVVDHIAELDRIAAADHTAAVGVAGEHLLWMMSS